MYVLHAFQKKSPSGIRTARRDSDLITERLMNLLTALDQDVEIVIRRKPRSRRAARISVVAA